MGNVPISCCRSKSPRLDSESRSIDDNAHYPRSNKSSNKHDLDYCDPASMQQSSQNILQHISEREPDDSDTDPSSNPLNRPIFAQRSLSSKNQQCRLSNAYDSYSSNNSASIARRQTLTPLLSSQDQGYTSGTSTNLTQYDGGGGGGHLTSSSFGSNSINPISNHQQANLLLPNQVSNLDVSQEASPGDSEHMQPSPHYDNETNKNIPYYSRRLYSSCIQNRDIGGNDDVLSYEVEDRLKASSCSTIFIDNSTISQPDLDQTIKCVTLAIYYHIRNRSSDEVSEIFDETIHPLRMPSNPIELSMNNPPNMQSNQDNNKSEELIILDNNNQTGDGSSKQMTEPDQETIYTFVKTLFNAAQLTSEYAITTLVYLERLMTYAEMDLAPKSWRRIFLGAILLSSKVWEDQAIWNVDYAQILEEISVDDINELERQFLELIQFNMNVPSSVYAKYYFHLRTLALKNGLTEEQTLMTTGKAKELEAMSKVHSTDDWFSSPIHRKSPPLTKKHTSLEKLRLNGHARAVLM